MQKPKEMYIQCSLEKKIGTAILKRITWANADKAIKGNEVKLEEDNGEWTTGWIVQEIYGPPLPREIVQHRSHDHTRQRISSDI